MFNKKKLRKETLTELAKRMPVLNEKKQVAFVGGGNGTREDPFSLSEYMDLGDLFQTGWVDFPDSISYMTCPYGEYYSSSGLDYSSGNDYDSGFMDDSGLYNDSGIHKGGGGYIDPDDVAQYLPADMANLYYNLTRNGQLTVHFIDLQNPPEGVEVRQSNAWVIINEGNNTIYISYISSWQPYQYVNDLRQELFHIYQDQTGIIDRIGNKSPIEYQENLMGWISNGTCGNALGESSSRFNNWLKSIKKNGTINLNEFKEGVSQWYGAFVNNHYGNYAQDQNLDYQNIIMDMNWKEVLELYGYNVK